ncbi:MAG: hypothetical protein II740_08050, partial [Lachnospiraceae bacterium]|nr:hypothetical protein [Lachnospiraceae bacterium]
MKKSGKILATIGVLAFLTVVGAFVFYVISQILGKTEPKPVDTLTETPIEMPVSSNEIKEEVTDVSAQEETVSENEEEETVSENEPEVIEEVKEPEPAPEAPKEEPSTEVINDTMAPIFLTFSGSPQVKVGDAFDIHK